MSSFRKASKSAADESGAPRLEGVKPWLNGQNLVSSGNRELDDILGGGHALGTLCLLHEDIHSNYAETLLQYSIAESISQGHKTLIICRNTAEAEQLIAGLPFNMNKSKLSIGKTEGPSTAEDRKKHLKIAWQYGKYIKDKETPKGRGVGSFCSSYDLASRMQPDVLEANYPRVFAVYRDRSSSDSLFDSDSSCECQLTDACHKIIRVISAFKQAHSNSRTPLRVFIPRLFGAPNEHNLNVPSACPALRNFFLFLRYLISPRMTVQVTLQDDTIPPGLGRHLNTTADTVLEVDSFAGHEATVPVEYRFFCGFLLIHKLQQIGAMVPHRPSAARFGLKRDRRKLHVEPLHLPPEDSRASKYATDTPTNKLPTEGSASLNKPLATVGPKGVVDAGIRGVPMATEMATGGVQSAVPGISAAQIPGRSERSIHPAVQASMAQRAMRAGAQSSSTPAGSICKSNIPGQANLYDF